MQSHTEHAVETLVAQSVPFDEIEQYIDGLPLDSDQRSALWLLAWAEATNPATRSRVMADTLALVD
jgi:hypothetical protein